jgi:hypothetical protein
VCVCERAVSSAARRALHWFDRLRRACAVRAHQSPYSTPQPLPPPPAPHLVEHDALELLLEPADRVVARHAVLHAHAGVHAAAARDAVAGALQADVEVHACGGRGVGGVRRRREAGARAGGGRRTAGRGRGAQARGGALARGARRAGAGGAP